MVLIQKWPFFQHFLGGNIAVENVFYNILKRKNPFLCYTNKKFKQSKNWHFSKRINPWFWSKNDHFSIFFVLGNIGQENIFYDILERQKRHSRLWKQEVQKVEKLTFSPKRLTHDYGPKMVIFQTFFFTHYWAGKCLYDIPERKNAFLGYKKKELQKVENVYFSKGVNPWFVSKNGHFSNLFFLGNIGQENVFYDILERQKRHSRL